MPWVFTKWMDTVPALLDTVPAVLDTVPALLDTVPAVLDTVPAVLDTVPALLHTVPAMSQVLTVGGISAGYLLCGLRKYHSFCSCDVGQA